MCIRVINSTLNVVYCLFADSEVTDHCTLSLLITFSHSIYAFLWALKVLEFNSSIFKDPKKVHEFVIIVVFWSSRMSRNVIPRCLVYVVCI